MFVIFAGRRKIEQPEFSIPLRIYYEDTDLAGIVYYANYLRYLERARTEWANKLGIDQMTLRHEEGIVFAVRRVEADYLRPALFGDDLRASVLLCDIGNTRIIVRQNIWRGNEKLFSALVVMVCFDEVHKKAVRMPARLREKFKQHLAD